MWGLVCLKKLYLSDQTTSRLALIWTKSDMSVKIYENGNLYQIGKLTSRERIYYDLNFDPIRQAKYISAPSVLTKMNKIYFNDSANNSNLLETMIKGTSDVYSLGCYEPKTKNVKSSQLQDDPLTSANEQCKKVCLGNLQQIYLLKELECICASNRWLFGLSISLSKNKKKLSTRIEMNNFISKLISSKYFPIVIRKLRF